MTLMATSPAWLSREVTGCPLRFNMIDKRQTLYWDLKMKLLSHHRTPPSTKDYTGGETARLWN